MLKKIQKVVEPITPTWLKSFIKKSYRRIMWTRAKLFYVKSGRLSELGSKFRFDVAAPYVARIGKRTIVEDNNVWNAAEGDIEVGEDCFIGLNNIIMGPVKMGNKVSTGPGVSIVGPRHPLDGVEEDKNKKTVIGDNVWISTGSIILFGVNIGENAVISAGAVVSKDVKPGSFIAGNPARDLTQVAMIRKAE